MPLVIRWPNRIPAGSVRPEFVQNIDFAPTLLHATDQPIPRDMQGRSFLPMMEGHDQPDWRDSVYYHYYEDYGSHYVRPHYGVRTQTHKLIRFYWSDGEAWEMYDLVNDPDELNSIYGNPVHATVQAELLVQLQKLREKYGVPGTKALRAQESFRD